jgi:hypothetical protein
MALHSALHGDAIRTRSVRTSDFMTSDDRTEHASEKPAEGRRFFRPFSRRFYPIPYSPYPDREYQGARARIFPSRSATPAAHRMKGDGFTVGGAARRRPAERSSVRRQTRSQTAVEVLRSSLHFPRPATSFRSVRSRFSPLNVTASFPIADGWCLLASYVGFGCQRLRSLRRRLFYANDLAPTLDTLVEHPHRLSRWRIRNVSRFSLRRP